METKKTWSIVADHVGGHWRAKVRRGVEGSRGLCGELVFDLSDAESVKDTIEEISKAVAHVAIYDLLELLREENLLRGEINPLLPPIPSWVERIERMAAARGLELAIAWFGARIDLARVDL